MYQSAYVVSAAMTSRTMTAGKAESAPLPLSAPARRKKKLRTAWCKSESVEHIRDSENTCKREMCQTMPVVGGPSRDDLALDRVQDCANAYVPRPI